MLLFYFFNIKKLFAVNKLFDINKITVKSTHSINVGMVSLVSASKPKKKKKELDEEYLQIIKGCKMSQFQFIHELLIYPLQLATSEALMLLNIIHV